MKTREKVDLGLIDDNPWQPRQEIDQDALQELAGSIHNLGLLQAPLGRRVENGRVQLAFGHRRVAACRLLHGEGTGLPHVDMDLADLSDEAMAVMALTENEFRKQLTQIEVVRAHKRAIDETSLTVQDLARQLGMDRSSLSNNLRVLELPALVLEHVESGALGLTVAREFLVFQHGDHTHTEDMRRVVDRIVKPYSWSDDHGPPDWRRRNVRKMICGQSRGQRGRLAPPGTAAQVHQRRRLSGRRPLMSKPSPPRTAADPAHHPRRHGGRREVRRVPRLDLRREGTWRSWQTRATREANKEEVGAGGQASAAPAKGLSRDKQFEQVLASDPVWKGITVSRETPGPDRPVTEEEKKQLGTRAELRDVPSYGAGFWKILQRARPEAVYDWQRESGGLVPPWFPDLKECQKCTIGAAYAKSRSEFSLSKVTLCCFNKEHYQEKLQVGEADYRAKLEAQRKGTDRQDLKAVERLMLQLHPLSEDTCQALAASLLAAAPVLELQHPLGIYHRDYSYESVATAKARELLSVDLVSRGWGGAPEVVVDLAALQRVESGDVRELVASLMAYHLRSAGKIETVSRETVAR